MNWFDITAPEGYYSLNDKLSDIMKSEEGKQFFMSMLSQMMGSMGGDKKDGNPANAAMANPKMFEMLGSFTVIRMMNLMGAAGPSLTKEQMLAINEQLNKIKRVD